MSPTATEPTPSPPRSPDSPGEPVSWRARLAEGPIAPIVVALAVHGVGLGGGFALDDVPDIVRHPVVGGDAPWWSVLNYNFMGAPLGEGVNTIRPLTTLELAAEWALWGDAAWLFHLTSVLLFAGLVWAAHGLARDLFRSGRLATVAASLFAVLAIHVEAVAMIANRAEVLSLLMVALMLRAALRGHTLAAALAYLAALLFKESAFLAPAALAWWFVVEHGPEELDLRKRGTIVGGLGVAALLFLAARMTLLPLDVSDQIVHPDNLLIGQPWAVRLWTPFVLLGRYLALTAAPVGLSYDYTYAAIPVALDLADPYGWLGALAVVGGGAGAVALWRREARWAKACLIALGGFAASYLLFSNSVFLIVILFAERLFLAPSLWLVLALVAAAWGGVEATREPERLKLLLGVAIGVVGVVQAPLAVNRTLDWRSDLTLMRAQVQTQPSSLKGRLAYASELVRHGRPDEALWHFGVAVAGRGRYPEPWSPPEGADQLPLEDRLRLLHGLIAPEVTPAAFMAQFGGMATGLLGEGVKPALERMRCVVVRGACGAR
ncbi:MAG: hypothetical protein CMH57_02370 [Myxococcales bacterium]|nr:hypothetical protein [Myxococcales bacterium]